MIKRRPIRNKLLLGGAGRDHGGRAVGQQLSRRLLVSAAGAFTELPCGRAAASELDASVGSLRLVHARALSGEAEFGVVGMATPIADGHEDEPLFAETFTGQVVHTMDVGAILRGIVRGRT